MLHRAKTLLSLVVFVPAAACAQRQAPPPVRPGIDVLLSDSAHLIAGKRVGLITNQAGVDAAGVSTMDRLHRASLSPLPSPLLVSLFAPEHGIRGAAAPGERINDTTDVATGLPIYSLYGRSRAPTPAQLESLDVVIVDLQDVGARPYTYISTAIYAMRAARAAGKRILVLDRPNPIGCAVQGPVLDTAYASSIGMLPVPLRHGMTMGEMALFANAELAIGADLVVVPVQGWSRCQWFDETGLPWRNPSPNLRDLDALRWYPGTVLLEATNLSVGRGTDAPFRQIGAPWLDAPAFGADTARLVPRQPGDGKYADIPIRAVRLAGGRNVDPVAYALGLLARIRARHPDSLRVDSIGFARRLGVMWRGETAWPDDVAAFRRRASPYLLYR